MIVEYYDPDKLDGDNKQKYKVINTVVKNNALFGERTYFIGVSEVDRSIKELEADKCKLIEE